jgi:histidinol-phosphate aminotransferase
MKFKTSRQIDSIKAYEPGKPIKELERELGIKDSVKLASNENPIGQSLSVIDAVKEHLSSMNRYPDPRAHDLLEAISKKNKIKVENIVIGNGSDEIIALLANAFLDTDEEALMPLPSFLMYEICVKIAKGTPVMVPLNNFYIDLDNMLEKITEKTRMIFLTNPFNPTGTVFTKQDFLNFAESVPEDILIIVDEAYIEFVKDMDCFYSLENPLNDKRVVTLRTFSKAYGLAGFRLGYGIMDKEVAKILHKIRPPFNVNSLAQAAGLAALNDVEFLDKSVDFILNGIDFIKNELDKIGLSYSPTHANFIMINVEKDSYEVFNDLLQLGVIVKSMKSYGFDNWIRVNAGTQNENKAFIKALQKVI